MDWLNAGADASLDWSPLNVNMCCWLLELDEELTAELPLLEACKRVHGTATILLPLLLD